MHSILQLEITLADVKYFSKSSTRNDIRVPIYTKKKYIMVKSIGTFFASPDFYISIILRKKNFLSSRILSP